MKAAGIHPNKLTYLFLLHKNYQEEYSKFLYSVLSQDSFFDYDMAGSKGSKMPRGDKNHIMNFPVTIVNSYEKIGNLIINIEAQVKRNNEMVQKLQSFKPALNFSKNGGIRCAS